jgi:hypothetical protein
LCENAKNRKVARMIFLRLAAIEPLEPIGAIAD